MRGQGWYARVIATDGQALLLRVVNPAAAPLNDDITVDLDQAGLWWFRWSFGVRIAHVDNLDIAAALKGLDTDLAEDAVLVTSELVTNAIAHGSAPVTLTVTVRTEPEPTVIIDVADVSPDLPVQDLPGEVGHFGLWIAEELAGVTVHPTSCGKTVRAAFALLETPTGPEVCSTPQRKPRWGRPTCAEDGDD